MKQRPSSIHSLLTYITPFCFALFLSITFWQPDLIAQIVPKKDSSSQLTGNQWTEQQKKMLRSLSLESLAPLPADPTNQFADNAQAATLGHKLFFDPRFSSNGQVSCASCHQPEKFFTDGLAFSKGVGTTGRSAPSIVGIAYSPWFFWDGRKDSQWSQALGPMESPVEHGGTRTQYAKVIDQFYRAEYEAIFGSLPDFSDEERFPPTAGPVDLPNAREQWKAMTSQDRGAATQVYANIGKAIAAYERLILPGASAFDQYVEALVRNDEKAMNKAMTPDQVEGLRLFTGNANCTQCHNGPLFTNNTFHNVGVLPIGNKSMDKGRIIGAKQVVDDEFNCYSMYSDAESDQECSELRFIKTEGIELIGAFKPPTLRNIEQTAPYMHAGQFRNLMEVLFHYNGARAIPMDLSIPRDQRPHSEIIPLRFSREKLLQLEAFLKSLTGPFATESKWLAPPQ